MIRNTLPLTRGQIIWRCRRGMLELDILLKGYAEKELDSMTPEQLDLFIELLEYSDQSLQEILMGKKAANTQELTQLAKTIHDAAASY